MKIKNSNEFIEQKPRSKKRKLYYATQLAHNEQGLALLGYLKYVSRQLKPNIVLKVEDMN